MARYLLDTTQIIDHLRGNNGTTSLLIKLSAQDDVVCSCCITVAETYSCIKEPERKLIKDFVESMEYLDATREIATKAGSLRDDFKKKGVTLSISDVLIAATALTCDAILITSNRKHFPMKELRIFEIKR